MSKHEVLVMLRELLRDASIYKSSPDDPSGMSTIYLVDHEQLMRNIEEAIASEGRGGQESDGGN